MTDSRKARQMTGLPSEAPARPAAADVAPKARERKTAEKVRTTVVLDAEEYDALSEFCIEVGKATGRRGVAASEVMRVLLGLLSEEDRVVRRKVQAQIETHGGNRRGR